MVKWGYMRKFLVCLAVVFASTITPIDVQAVNVSGTDSGTPSSGSSSYDDCAKNFLGFRPWYKGLTDTINGKCEVRTPSDESEITTFVVAVILNVLADLLVAVGYLTLGFIIYGGYLYITASGDPGKVAKGKKTITSAIIGAAIAILGNVIINLIVGVLTTSA